MSEEKKDILLEKETDENTTDETIEKKVEIRARPSTIKVPIDYLKYIIKGEDYYINENIILHNPTIEEIIDFGEQKYLQLISILTMRPYDDMVGLDDAGLNYQDFTDFDMFLRNYRAITPDMSSIILPDINLTEFVVAIKNDTGATVLLHQEKQIVIDELVFAYIAGFVRTINFISSKLEYDVGNEVTRQYLIKKKRKAMKRKAKKPSKPFESFLSNVISFLCSHNGCKYNYDSILNLTIGQIYDNFYRISAIDERERYLNILSTGMVKRDKTDTKKLNWTRSLIDDD